ncbi:MAG TPA: peptidoglycan-binding protein [Candidatus Paceibacterota bacterium]|nr:peptidoglycan-binding protein [Candidatus Paceibacterota bacterium]
MKKLLVYISIISTLAFGALGATFAHAQTYYNDGYYPEGSSCTTLTLNLGVGATDASSGGQVSALQNFLNQYGYMQYPVTGYFGTLTMRAVQSFQSASGFTPVGALGPLTRAKIQSLTCGGGGSTIIPPTGSTVTLLSMSPTYGSVGTFVTLSGYGFVPGDTVHFGSGTISQVNYVNQNTLTFTVPSYLGAYCAYGQACPMYAQQVTNGSYPVSVTDGYNSSNVLTFTVGYGSGYYWGGGYGSYGAPTITAINPTSGGQGTQIWITGNNFTQGSTVAIGGNGYSFTVQPYIQNSNQLYFTFPTTTNSQCFVSPCTQQYLSAGTYQINVSNGYGSSNPAQFILNNTAGYGTLSITGIDAPSSLAVYNSGTWTVHVSGTNSNYLHYSVVWGDKGYYGSNATSQSYYGTTATFTHAYQTRGTFTPRFTVTDDYGHSITSSTTVNVY